MSPDPAALYNAYASRDSRFDGVFFIGVTSTGIYCRPVCTAKTPKAANCRFFDSAATAEKASFRPCLRCRPELAPGNAPVDDAHRIASLIAQRIDEGTLDAGGSLETIAAQFGWSSRQIRRIVTRELGVSPIELVLTRRLLLAKQLLTETSMPIIDVAFASGFSSVRRFNDAFSSRYGMPPSRFRKSTELASVAKSSDTFTLQLSYRPPYDWQRMLHFFSTHAMKDVELIRDDCYRRTVQLGAHTGWICVQHAPKKRALTVEITHSLTPALPALLGRLRHLFDLSARPDVIALHLARDARLAPSVALRPGLRVPGAFDGFELAARAILGQQITVKAATTISGRFAERFGDPIVTPFPELTRLSPTAERLATATVDDVAPLGIIQTRARSIIAVAQELVTERLELEPGAKPERALAQLVALPGIGAWTAQYVVMRALRYPDAFPKEDIALRNVLGGVTAARAEQLSEEWRPWRSYATMHLWSELTDGSMTPLPPP